ncbi:MAG: DUF167 domain-containing protein [bacterium JZ-2024 1]
MDTKKGVRLRIKVKPRAKKSVIIGIRGGNLVVSVVEPPEKGEANSAVCALIAEVLGLPKSRVAMVAGATSSLKVVEASGISAAIAEDRLRKALI